MRWIDTEGSSRYRRSMIKGFRLNRNVIWCIEMSLNRRPRRLVVDSECGGVRRALIGRWQFVLSDLLQNQEETIPGFLNLWFFGDGC